MIIEQPHPTRDHWTPDQLQTLGFYEEAIAEAQPGVEGAEAINRYSAQSYDSNVDPERVLNRMHNYLDRIKLKPLRHG